MERQPALFFGHGNPMNALERNAYTEAWAAMAQAVPRPRAILAVSAHWYVPGTLVTAMDAPRTIHDFGGFPRALYEKRYPAPGSPALARRVQELLAPATVGLDQAWGLDHGTWSVLCHAFPAADVPVVQLSIDETQPAAFHFALGRRLRPLRDEGVLIAGSGNVVHNLHAYAWGRHPAAPLLGAMWSGQSPDRSTGGLPPLRGFAPSPPSWALRFEAAVRRALEEERPQELVDYEALGRDALLSVPTPEHYLPLLYVLGARDEGEPVTFPIEGIDGGSVSMLAVRLG